MLLKLEKLIAKYGMKITGVIQAGAHEGQEVGVYLKENIYRGYFFEPIKETFLKLINVICETPFMCYCVALGNLSCKCPMFKETKNNGQSNSLLKPKLHIEYYPDIVFNDSEIVDVKRLDEFNISNCNLLVLDTQGTELEVLKGATETLKHIDYIYTEVNREELYENCAMVEDLDNYLTEFKRVQTVWKRKGYGDALYIRKTLL